MAAPDYAEYLDQLDRLPGGPAAALADFLGPWLAAPVQGADADPACWWLREGGRLSLRPEADGTDLLLVHEDETEMCEIARFGRELTEAAALTAQTRTGGDRVSPLVLALLAIAAGDVDDGRRLKRRLPGLDGAARDLMLMTLCRLCG